MERPAPTIHSRENGSRYWLLLGLQTIGALIILRFALPLYRDAVANPVAHRASVGPLIWGSAAVILMQTGFWIRHRLQPPLPRFQNALIGYLVLFAGRMSLLVTTAIFGFVFITQRPDFHIPFSRYVLTLAGFFSYFCYTQELERLAKSLIETPEDGAD
jgi:hypothetical protein